MEQLKTMKRFNTNNNPKRISSREVAEMMGVRHCDLLEKIDRINENLQNANFRSDKYWVSGNYTAGTGKQYREYQVTKKGCELIAHKTEGQKGVEFTVRYMDRFEEMEQLLDYSALPANMQMFIQLFNNQAEMYLEHQKMKESMEHFENKVDSIKEVVAMDSTNWREETNKILRKIGKGLGGQTAFRDIRIESYDLLNRRMGVKLETRLENKRKRMMYEGCSRTQCNNVSMVDIIAEDKKLIEGYVAIVKELAIKYGIA